MERVAETCSNAELREMAARLGRDIAQTMGELLDVVGELDRRAAFEEEGAISMTAWLTERLGVSEATARMWTQTAERLWDLPSLAANLASGELSFDKVRAAASFAVTDNDADVAEQAKERSVLQLNALARDSRGAPDAAAEASHDGRYLRFNDARRTVTAQLSPDHYAQVHGMLSDEARRIPSDGLTRWDQRLCDALVRLCQPSASRTSKGGAMVVLHADLSMLRGGRGTAELERLGLLSRAAARRMACDAEVALAIDDAFGHTMVEGHARRFPTDAQRREVWRRDRHCRFPGCSNAVFTKVHHVVHWIDGGPTDLDNLVLLCDHHHHTVHESRWQVSGNPNGTMRFLGPTKRLMESKPSPLWTRRN
jgi:hypothetical protein